MIIRDIYDGLCEYLWLNNPMSHYFPFLAHSACAATTTEVTEKNVGKFIVYQYSHNQKKKARVGCP